jgi:hypothetical protein
MSEMRSALSETSQERRHGARTGDPADGGRDGVRRQAGRRLRQFSHRGSGGDEQGSDFPGRLYSGRFEPNLQLGLAIASHQWVVGRRLGLVQDGQARQTQDGGIVDSGGVDLLVSFLPLLLNLPQLRRRPLERRRRIVQLVGQSGRQSAQGGQSRSAQHRPRCGAGAR